ncbi:MAG: MFS transporter, partial [Burkholderiales bacterium]|nr:MFS transporter [Burkholderiales bacterium]
MTPAAFSLRQIALTAFGPSLLFGLGEGAILPVIPLTARAMGASVPLTALLVGLIGIGSLLSNIPASLLTMRHGERWAIVAGAIWCVVAMALCGWSGNLGGFAMGCFMIGMSQAIFSLARQSYLTEVVPVEYRARVMSTLGGTMRIGMFIGPFVAAAAIHFYGLAGAYGVGMAALLASGALAARLPDLKMRAVNQHQDATSGKPSALTILSTLRVNRHVFVTLGLGMLLVSAVRTTRQTAIPLWADNLAIDAAVTAVIYGLASGVEMLLFYPAGKVMDQMGRRWVVVPSLVFMGAGLLLLPLTH